MKNALADHPDFDFVLVKNETRSALHAWEKAEEYAEACRLDWCEARDWNSDLGLSASGLGLVQASVNYSEAANAAVLARRAYEALVMAEVEKTSNNIAPHPAL